MLVINGIYSIIIVDSTKFAFGSAEMVFLIQMAKLFVGVAKFFQAFGFSPVVAQLPVMLGISFAFVRIMISIVKSSGIVALFDAVLVNVVFNAALVAISGRILNCFPLLVTGMVITTIDLYLQPVWSRICRWWRTQF